MEACVKAGQDTVERVEELSEAWLAAMRTRGQHRPR
jgi:hypothetical protein